jgi:hypothetical protein
MFMPFRVKKAVPVRKFTPHPTVSCGPYFWPYARPCWLVLKICPSSLWYAQDSGSQPGSLFRVTFCVQKPKLTSLLRIVSDECASGDKPTPHVP